MPKGVKLLVVDDDAAIVRGLTRLLRNHWDVVPVHSVPDAVERIAQGGIEVVLSDWNMPYGGGRVVMEAAHAAGIGVAIQTASTDFKDSHKGKAEVVIGKCFSLSEADAAIWKALNDGRNRDKLAE